MELNYRITVTPLKPDGGAESVYYADAFVFSSIWDASQQTGIKNAIGAYTAIQGPNVAEAILNIIEAIKDPALIDQIADKYILRKAGLKKDILHMTITNQMEASHENKS